MTIRTDDMETAGEMVQDLCNFLQVRPENQEKKENIWEDDGG